MLMPRCVMRALRFCSQRTHAASVAVSRRSWQPWMKEVGELTCLRGLAVQVAVALMQWEGGADMVLQAVELLSNTAPPRGTAKVMLWTGGSGGEARLSDAHVNAASASLKHNSMEQEQEQGQGTGGTWGGGSMQLRSSGC